MSIFKEIGKVGKGVLGIIAPTLAGALPGPVGSIAREAVTKLLDLPAESTDAEIEAQLAKASPETLIKLREADHAFQAQMKQLDVDLVKIAAADTADARARNIAVKDKTTPILGWTIVASWIACMGALFGVVPPPQNEQLLNIMFGILTASTAQVIGYYFGSSMGSKAKTDAMVGGKK